MCTVCGVATEAPDPANAEIVLDMLRRTRPRGPDACGVHFAGKVHHAADAEELAARLEHDGAGLGAATIVLGQSRLTITGSRHGRQPFVGGDKGRLALAHNGEVYNHVELRRLIDDPEDADTGSDSEVLMRVLEHHHEATAGDLPEAMRRTVAVASGMYALAATDGEVVVLARDAIGKKPLYYTHGDGRFAWASERKALVEVARAAQAPIRRLRPGELLTHEPGLPPRVETVERLTPPPIDTTDPERALAIYQEALDRAITRRTRGLTRAAVLFSGGVDSVLVARLLQNAGLEVTGYVAGVEGSADVRHAVEVAREMGLPVHVSQVDEPLLEAWLPRILAAVELNGPLMAEVSIPMWFAAKAAHEDGHRVIFTGQAADELWAGYDWYRDVLRDHGPLTLHARMWQDVRALPLDTLEREDRLTMAWSLECRAPFLDAEVIRTAFRVSPELKIHGPDDAQRKHPHRALAMRVGVPASVAYRAKEPAQDGAKVHDLLASLAARRFPNGPPPELAATEVADFGSIFRYRGLRSSTYSTPEVRALLHRITEEHGFVVAGEDGSAHAPVPRSDGKRARPPSRRGS